MTILCRHTKKNFPSVKISHNPMVIKRDKLCYFLIIIIMHIKYFSTHVFHHVTNKLRYVAFYARAHISRLNIFSMVSLEGNACKFRWISSTSNVTIDSWSEKYGLWSGEMRWSFMMHFSCWIIHKVWWKKGLMDNKKYKRELFDFFKSKNIKMIF